MVDNPPPSSQPDEGGVAALAPQFDLAVTASSRRSAPPIGSLSPQPTSYAPFPRKRSSNSSSTTHPPQSSPSLVAADFLQEAAFHASGDIHPPPRTQPSPALPFERPPPPPPPPLHLQPQPATPPHISPQDFEFGFASLDLGPPVLENTFSPPHTHHTHLQPALRQPALLTSRIHPTTSSPLPSPPTVQLNHPSSPLRASSREQQHPTRCVLLRNIPPGIDDEDIRNLLQLHGPLRDLGAQQRSRGGRGSVLATYYDLRHARAAVRSLDGAIHFGRRLDARFQCPSDIAPNPAPVMSPAGTVTTAPCANQGTLVVFNLDNTTSAEEIRTLFSTMGDVKEIRATPNKKHHKFVEFYDIRDAERAMRSLNKTEVNGKRIKIEISRPGGRAANFTRHAPGGATAPKGQPQHVHQQGQTSVPHPGQPLTQRHMSHAAMHQMQQTAEAAAAAAAAAFGGVASPRHLSMEPAPASSPHIPTALLNSINHTLPPPQLPTFGNGPDIGAAFEDPSPRLNAGVETLVGSTGFDAASPPQYSGVASYDGAYLNSIVEDGIDYASLHASYDPLGDARLSSSPVDQRLTDLHQLYSNHVAELGNKYPSNQVIGQRGATPRYAADSYLQALYSSPSSEENGKLASPKMGSPTLRAPYTVAKHDSLGGDVAPVHLYKTSSPGDAATGNTSDGIANSNLNNFPNPHTGPTASHRKIGGPSQSSMVSIVGERGHAKQGNSKSNTVSNAPGHNKQLHQQHLGNSKYALDIRKVRAGEETRTALMIRNIPNKYNQKMLLSTLEEHHRGHFDFIYLPIDFKNKCNVGYAFINFTKPEYIEPFYNGFHGKKWGRFNSEKVCEITFARIQGRQQLIAHFQNSSLLLEDPKCRPVIFDAQGRQEEFPIGSHVRTRRGPSSRDTAHRSCEGSPPYSPTKPRGRS